MSEVIEIGKPEMTDYAKVNFATEVAFTALLKQARDLGLPIGPVMGLMYMPDQKDTQNFQEACRAILKALTIDAETYKELHDAKVI